MYEMWTNMHRIERDPAFMSGLNSCDHDLLQPTTTRPSYTAVNETHEFECQYSTQEMHTMTKVLQTFHDNIKCGP